jgi:aspartate racemase
MFSVDFGKIKDFQQEENTHNYIQEFVNAIENLEKAGADFAVIASNTPHRVFSEIDKQVSIPLISIVDVIAEHLVKHNFKKILLLGTKYTMSEEFYKKGLQSRGVETIVPSYDEQIIVNNIIFDELVLDHIIQSSKQKLIKIIEKYPADAVILGCTELPLIIKKEDVHLPIIDTTDVFAEATLNFALL